MDTSTTTQDDTSTLCSTAKELMQQFEKIVAKINTRAAASARAGAVTAQRKNQHQRQHQHQARGDAAAAMAASKVCQCDKPAARLPPLALAHGHHQPQPQEQRSQQETNESNFTVGCFQSVVMEPSELRLVLKLHTRIADNGSLVVQPSVLEDRATGCGDAAASIGCQQLQLPPLRLGYSSDNSDDADLAATADVVRQQVIQQQQKQQLMPALQSKLRQATAPAAALESRRSLRSLNASVQQIARHLGASCHGGSGSGGDNCQMNNHHDSSSVSDDQMSGQSSGTSDSEATGSFGQKQQPVAGSTAASPEPIDRTTRALIRRLNEFINKDKAADCDLDGS